MIVKVERHKMTQNKLLEMKNRRPELKNAHYFINNRINTAKESIRKMNRNYQN